MARGKKGRNKNRQGGYSERGDGRLDVYLTVDTPTGPKQLRSTKRTEDEAERQLVEWKYDYYRGAPSYIDSDVSKMNVAEFVDWWLDGTVKPKVRTVTYINYRGFYERHLAPTVGQKNLQKLTPAQVQAWKMHMIQSGVGRQTIGQVMRLLKRALSDAVVWELVSRNAAREISPPSYKPKETAYIKFRDLGKYFEAIRGDKLEALFLIAITDGLRSAELLALRWNDWDEEAGELVVDEGVIVLPGGVEEFNPPKTEAGKRRVPLSEIAQTALREHHRKFLEKRMQTGERGEYTHTLIFPNPSGNAYRRMGVRKRWRKCLGEAGLPYITIHGLRHTASMLLARSKTAPRTAQGILGHSDVTTTLRIYTHFEQEDATAAVKIMDDLLRSEFPSEAENGEK